MRMEITIGQKLDQRLVMAPQILQSIEILQMNVTDLRAHIEEKMLENPTMELLDDNGEPKQNSDKEPDDSFDDKPSAEVTDLVEPESNTAEALERELERLESLHESWKEFSDFGRRSYGGDKDKKLEAMQNAPERSETLQEHIFAQIMTAPKLDDRQRAIGEFLAYNLDENGYLHTESGLSLNGLSAKDALLQSTTGEITEDFAQGVPVEPPAEVDEVEEVLHVIQECDPPGVGARSLRECLLIQIGMPDEYVLERRIVRDHLEDVMMNRLPKIAKATGEPIELINEAIRFIRMLNPKPGSIFAETRNQYVTPDITITQIDGEWRVILEDDYLPHIRISPRYMRMLTEKSDDPKVLTYVKKKIESAHFLMDAIQQRQATLKRIAQEIVDYQKDFFDVGVDALKPLKMQYIADKVGVHVSTVSRAIKKKYMQTPRGIFALRYFFKGGATLDDGGEMSVVAIKNKVQEIVDKEDKNKPLSDEEIANKLRDDGLDIARRTITKYRKHLNIPSSRQRRRFV